ncbi:MAG: hypothetical protein NVS4B3_04010 [Gemmatimonadaceae bacterium]
MSALSASAGYSTPLLHVAELERSIRFYELLGFTTIDTDRASPLGWARLHCEGGAVMLVKAEDPIDTRAQGVLLYMYTSNLINLREQLVEHGMNVPTIYYPEYMPSGEIRLADPDGYVILVAHWGKAEHVAWERRIGGKS